MREPQLQASVVLWHGGVVLLNFVARSTAGDEQQEEQEEEKCLRSHGDQPACTHGTINQIESSSKWSKRKMKP